MLVTIINSVLTFIVSTLLGYCINSIKNYKKEKTTQEEALICLLRSNITSKYYVYTELGEIPEYEKANIDYMYEQYEKMGGNSYIKRIVEEINHLPIKK